MKGLLLFFCLLIQPLIFSNQSEKSKEYKTYYIDKQINDDVVLKLNDLESSLNKLNENLVKL